MPGIEDVGTYDVPVEVAGSGTTANNVARQVLTLSVEPPPITITVSELPDGYPNRDYSAPLSATGGSGQHTWSLNNSELPDGLELNRASDGSWSIVGMPEKSASRLAPYAVTLLATDVMFPSVTATITLSLWIVPDLSILTTNIPSGVSGTPYDTTLQSFGGIAPYTYAATNLPPGLSVFADAGGVWHIGGVLPLDVAGSYDVTLTATDSDSLAQTDIMRLMLMVNEPETPSIAVITTYLSPVTNGESYAPFMFEASGGTAPYTWSAAGLPAGLTLYSNGLLAGTVEADAGEYTITVQVRDSSATPLVATANYLLIVTAGSTAAVTGDDSTPASSAGLSSALVGAAAAGCSMSGSDDGLMMLAVLIFLASMTALRVRAARHAGARVSSNTGRNTA